MAEFGVLLLGPESCGKTLLLKSLQYFVTHNSSIWDFGSIPRHGRPTLGVEMANFTFPLPDDLKKKKLITVKELGGRMAPLWPTYFASGQSDGLIYCIDSLNPFQASRAAVELANLLHNSKLRETAKSVLIVFTKSADLDMDTKTEDFITDSNKSMSVMELRNMMLLDDIVAESKLFYKTIEFVTKCSAVNGVGLVEILAWVERISRN